METINFVIAVPLGIIALFFVYIGWRRGNRFNFHDYQGDSRERLRDSFFSSFPIITGISCILPIIAPLSLWGFIVPITLVMVLVVTPLSMLGAYWSSFLANAMTRGKIRNIKIFGQSETDISALEWYEFIPFAFVGGWVVYYLVYVSLLLALGYKISSDNAPTWIIAVGLAVGVTTAMLATFAINRKFRTL